MVKGKGENGLAKSVVIERLMMEYSYRKPPMSPATLAYSIDHALINAGFESHLRVDYENNLHTKENRHLGKELHQFLAEQGITADTVRKVAVKVAVIEAEGFRQLLKQLDAEYGLVDKASIHTPSKQRSARLNNHC